MINSIQHFGDIGVGNIFNARNSFLKEPHKQAEFVYEVTQNVVQLGLAILAETYEEMDQAIRADRKRKQKWHIVRRDTTSLLTSLGEVTYQKTLFKNKKTGESSYLLDQLMGLESHVRMTEDAGARILEEAVESSYRKGGERSSILGDRVSKQTVMNKVHALKFPEYKAPKAEKKQVSYLYIDADEDHVSLQYQEEKGDLKKQSRKHTIMPKLAYVYEDIDTCGNRPKLVNVHYFGGVYEGSAGVEKFWREIYTYIESTYDLSVLKRIYIHGDGAPWIQSGPKWIDSATFVLDRFHRNQYILAATSHLLDSAQEARMELYRGIHQMDRGHVKKTFKKILLTTDEDSRKYQTVEGAMNYILGNWKGIRASIEEKAFVKGCSAEGHVSHIYAARMSSRPLGWSRLGVDKMARLRVYQKNGGNMLELIRYQHHELPQAAGAEELSLPLQDILSKGGRVQTMTEKYAQAISYSIPYPHVKKIASFKGHIWGL